MRKSEKAVLAIGTVNIFLLFLASALSSTGNIADAGVLVLIFVHIIIIIGAFPILYRAIFGQYSVSKNFTIIFTIIAVLSSILVLSEGSFFAFDEDDYFFFTLGIIELLPLLWLYIKKRDRIWQPPKKLPYDLGY